jgi:hypothetical protein
MKNIYQILFFSLFTVNAFAQQATEIDSKFVKLPRYANFAAITTAIVSPTQGMMVYNIDTKSNWTYNGSAWTNNIGAVSAPLYLTSTTTTITGETNQADESGILGINTTDGVSYGVIGKAFNIAPEENGAGVWGDNKSTNNLGFGIKGTHEGTGWAGYFEGTNALKTQGNAYLNGDVGIGTDSPLGKLTVNTQSVNWNFPNLLLIDNATDNSGGAILQFRNPSDKRMYLQSHFGSQADGSDSYMTFSHNAFYNMRLRGDGNLGIGSLNPNLAGLVVNKKVGNSHAIFGDNTSGVSIESNFPGIHFNSYYNGSRKTISTGFTAGAELNPTTGDFSIYTSPASTTAGNTASVFERLKITKEGVVNVGNIFILKNSNALNTGISSTIGFGGTNYTTGLISTIGTSSSAARMGFFTGYSFSGGVGNMQERLTILNNGNVGVGKIDPTQKMEVNGKIKISDDAISPDAGTVRWNAVSKDFEGYNGNIWISLTKSNQSQGWDPTFITENQTLTPSDDNFNNEFGGAIEMQNEWAFIGDPLSNKVYIFKMIDNQWTEKQILQPSGLTSSDRFGFSLTVKNTILAIGNPKFNSNSGRISIYKNVSDVWTFDHNVNNTVIGEELGYQVSLVYDYLSGYFLAASKPFKTVSGKSGQGQIIIYTFGGYYGPNFSPSDYVITSDGLSNDNFGLYPIQLLAYNVLIAGNPKKNNSTGKVYIFQYTSGVGFVDIGSLTPPSPVINQKFGWSVRAFGDHLVIGSYGGLSTDGSAYFYKRISGGNTYSFLQKINCFCTGFGDSVTGENNYSIISSALEKKAYLYKYDNNSNNWSLLTNLLTSDYPNYIIDDPTRYFGSPVIMQNNSAMIGGKLNNLSKVYFYKRN